MINYETDLYLEVHHNSLQKLFLQYHKDEIFLNFVIQDDLIGCDILRCKV